MRKYLYLLLALCIPAAPATSINFAWDPDPAGYPEGTTYDLYANEASTTGITGLTQSLDVVGAPGEPLSAGVRAVPPAGYQCGDPPVECQPSYYGTLNTVIPGIATIPLEGYGGCATAEEQGGGIVADPAFGAIGSIDSSGGSAVSSLQSTITGVSTGDLVLAFIQRDGMSDLTGVSATGITFSNIKTASTIATYGNDFEFDVWAGLATQNVSSMVITASFSSSDLWGSMSSARYSGVASATPVASSCNDSGCTSLASSATTRRAQSISPGVRSLLVFAGTDWNDYRSHTAGTGFTERMDGSGTPVTSIQFLHDSVQDAGAYGGTTNLSTTSASDRYLSVLLAFEASDQGGGAAELDVNDATQIVKADVPTFTSANILTAADCALTVLSDQAPMTQASVLAAADAAVPIEADGVTVAIGVASLDVADGLVGITEASASMVQASTLTAGDGLIAASAEQASMTQASAVTVSDAMVTVLAESPGLSQQSTVTIDGATVQISSGVPGITSANILAADDALVTILADAAQSVQASVLTADEAAVGLSAEQVVLALGGVLEADDAFCTVTVDAAALVAQGVLTADDAALVVRVDSVRYPSTVGRRGSGFFPLGFVGKVKRA